MSITRRDIRHPHPHGDGDGDDTIRPAVIVHAEDIIGDANIRLVEEYVHHEWFLNVQVTTPTEMCRTEIASRTTVPPAPAAYLIEATTINMRRLLTNALDDDPSLVERLTAATETLLAATTSVWAVCGDNVDGCAAAHYYALGGHTKTTLGGHLIPTVWHTAERVTAYTDHGPPTEVVVSWWAA